MAQSVATFALCSCEVKIGIETPVSAEFDTHRSRDSAQRQLSAIINYNIDGLDNLIRDTLWEELPESYDEHAISKYRMQIYEYVFTRYRSVA